MQFRRWLAEVGMGGGGPGSGMAPPLQRPDLSAMADYSGPEGSDPKNQSGTLPPVRRKKRDSVKSPNQTGPFSLARRGAFP